MPQSMPSSSRWTGPRPRRAIVAVAAVATVVALLATRQITTPMAARRAEAATASSATTPRAAGLSPSSARAPHADPATVDLGRKIFFDTRLSEPVGTSCASCHDPSRAYSGNHGSTNGVALGSRPGHFAKRNTPSALYLRFVPRFHFHWEEDMPLNDAFAGLFWDGRVDSVSELVRQPLFNPDEMNGGDAARIAEKLRTADYAADFQRLYGAPGAPEQALADLSKAVEAFLTSDEMAPFTSKYDDVIRGRARFTDLEARGLTLFKNREKGNCLSCHKFDDGVPDPTRSPFTDYGFEVVGVPRNRQIPADADPKFADLGLCERQGARKATHEDRFCGAFRTPSLRNVAVRGRFMHNGAFASLRQVLEFYATRDADPSRWYPKGERFDDLPAQYREYVNTNKVPYSTAKGGTPRLDAADIDALLAFLGTLTDAQYR